MYPPQDPTRRHDLRRALTSIQWPSMATACMVSMAVLLAACGGSTAPTEDPAAPPSTGTTPAPAPTPGTPAPAPTPGTPAPAPMPGTPAPAPAPGTPAPAPMPGTPAPAPAPGTPAPAPAPGTPAPAPAPGTPAPAPAPGTPAPAPMPGTPAPAPAPTSLLDANRLAHQATFGPNEALVQDVSAKGIKTWIAEQLFLQGGNASSYTSGGGADVHQVTNRDGYCDGAADNGNCWRENLSSEPLLRDFYSNALTKPDQLRQRVAFALGQIVVVSNRDISGTYGFRNYQNMLLQNALGNYRDVLRKVTLSPVMGDFLDNANNDKAAPNENYARELMQLFSIGVCELNADGTLRGGVCTPTYTNEQVRNVAFALTGWTYPAGGASKWGCPKERNCRFYEGDMVPVPNFHDTEERALLSGVTVPAGSSPGSALDAVLNSLMSHPNIAPFISQQLIQHLVMSNPSPAYVGRVSAAFNAGSYQGFGKGQKGDLAATVAAILLDPEARRLDPLRSDGKLREPALMFTSVLRALEGSAGDNMVFSWYGDMLGQRVFAAPSVFNFYSPDYSVPGSSLKLMGPAFGIHNASTAINRMEFLNCAVRWDNCGGMNANIQHWVDQYVADGTPTATTQTPRTMADEKLVDRLSMLAYGQPLPADERAAILEAMNIAWSPPAGRVRQAAFLIFASPRFQLSH